MPQEQGCELLPLNAIRTETVLSRFPIHNLAKKGRINIHIKQQNENGEVELYWDVSYSDKHGQARQLAYKLDTLIINRRIEEAGRPLPKIIRLGSLRDIAEELGLGGDTSLVKKALRQNAFASITAKFKYKGNDGKERTLEADFQRYSVVFTGETLPDGKNADAVCLVLNDIYREVLDTAPYRPLDYDYLKSISPAAQRCYEIISYRIFPAIKHKTTTAKISYSEYCTYSGQERYFEREKARKQMWKLHQPHLKSGYFAEARFENISNHEGEPDWMLVYVPGKKALDEFKAFTKKQKGLLDAVVDAQTVTAKSTSAPKTPEPEEPQVPPLTAEEQSYVNELANHFSIHEDTATALVTSKLEQVKFQIEVYPYRQHGRIKDKAAYIIRAIERNYTAPGSYAEEKARREREKDVLRAKELEAARKAHEEKNRGAYYAYLRDVEEGLTYDAPDELEAFEEHNSEALAKAKRLVTNMNSPGAKAIFNEEARLERFIKFFEPRGMVMSFWQWDEAQNKNKFTFR